MKGYLVIINGQQNQFFLANQTAKLKHLTSALQREKVFFEVTDTAYERLWTNPIRA